MLKKYEHKENGCRRSAHSGQQLSLIFAKIATKKNLGPILEGRGLNEIDFAKN